MSKVKNFLKWHNHRRNDIQGCQQQLFMAASNKMFHKSIAIIFISSLSHFLSFYYYMASFLLSIKRNTFFSILI